VWNIVFYEEFVCSTVVKVNIQTDSFTKMITDTEMFGDVVIVWNNRYLCKSVSITTKVVSFNLAREEFVCSTVVKVNIQTDSLMNNR
jgi:fructose/tagatose bisphosphate aldolase